MSQNFYPTASQIGTRLYVMRVISAPPTAEEAQMDYDSACNAAWQAWEKLTGFEPFLAETIDSTFYYDIDNGVTDLDGGYVSITSVSLNATGQTINQNYTAMPKNALAKVKPVTYLMWGARRFVSPSSGLAGPVAVVGKRGAYAVLPSLAYEGILAIAIDSLLGQSEFSTFGGVISWKSGTTEEKYDPDAYARLCLSAQARIRTAVASYRRTRIA